MMEPVAWKWEDKTGAEWLCGDRDDAQQAAAIVSAVAEPLVRLSDAEARIAELEAKLRAETFRADTNDKFMKDHFEASTAKSVEIQNLRAYITKTAKEVAETIDQMRKQDVSVEQRARAEAAEALLKEAREALEPFTKYAQDDCFKGSTKWELVECDRPGGAWFGAEDFRAARAIHDKIGVKDE